VRCGLPPVGNGGRSVIALHPGLALSLLIRDGHAPVEGAQDYEAANAVQKALREVVCAICSDELRSTEFAALIYADDSLDGDE
jgi:hypothetical protein